MKKNKLKRKKIEFNLVKCDLEDTEDEQRTCMQKFNNAFMDKEEVVSSDVVEDEDIDEAKDRDEEVKTIGANKKISKESRELFKKIALKTHPDRLINADAIEREEKNILYLAAQRAAEDDDLATLIEVSTELGIDSGIEQEVQIKILQQKIDFIREKIHNIKQSACWVWEHSDGPQREQVEKQLVSLMGYKKRGI